MFKNKVSFTDALKIEYLNFLLDSKIEEVVILSTCNKSECLESISIDPTIETLNDKCVEIRNNTLNYIYRKVNLDTREQKIIDKMYR